VRSKTFGKRLAVIATLNAVAGATLLALSSAPAHATTTLGLLKNNATGTCLTGGIVQSNGTGVAWVSTCNTANRYQQWDWVEANSYWRQLKNRGSGLCLITDTKNAVNSVWTSGCRGDLAAQWEGPNTDFNNRFYNYFPQVLRTEPRPGDDAVKADGNATLSADKQWTVLAAQ
jgi:hypothetical protein